MSHVHHFRAITCAPFRLTRWHCSCGLRVASTKVAKALEGKSS